MPFEKGDRSQEVVNEDGTVSYVGARWTRDNPLVIDWSRESVRLLRARVRGSSSRRKPYFRNERLWFTEGVTWNSLARYLRARELPPSAIFGHMAPLIRPRSGWMTPEALLAVLNSGPVDFLLRTFVGSLMHIEIGDVRRIPVPVLSNEQSRRLTELARRAIAEKRRADAGGPSRLTEVEAEIDAFVRDLYGVPRDAELWVVR